MSTPLVSIIIPFYNQGQFLLETISSAISQSYSNVEVIIVDDGSTDEYSRHVFDEIEHPIVKKYRTINQGLSSARNTAIFMASGKYILPLDSDDLISNTYVESAVRILEMDETIGIVYSNAMFFGEINGLWELPEFELTSFLTSNCIYASAFYRKADWRDAGGYKSDMIYGLEDYDFWLSLIGLGRNVYRIPDIHFFYRKHGPSMVSKLDNAKLHYSYARILERHKKLYSDNLIHLISRINDLKNSR